MSDPVADLFAFINSELEKRRAEGERAKASRVPVTNFPSTDESPTVPRPAAVLDDTAQGN